MVGANAEETDYIYLYGERSGLFDQNYPELNLANKTGKVWIGSIMAAHPPVTSDVSIRLQGYYLLELNGRYDGSSVSQQ